MGVDRINFMYIVHMVKVNKFLQDDVNFIILLKPRNVNYSDTF